jgi:hypothetical protein
VAAAIPSDVTLQGDDERVPMRDTARMKLPTLVAPMVIVAALLACKQPEGGSNATPSAPREPTVTVEASTLLEAYKSNQVAADQVYKNQRVRVSGVVNNVTNAMFGNGINVNINGGGQYEFTHVACGFGTPPANVATLSKGTRFTAVCDCTGGTTVGVQLSNCTM